MTGLLESLRRLDNYADDILEEQEATRDLLQQQIQGIEALLEATEGRPVPIAAEPSTYLYNMSSLVPADTPENEPVAETRQIDFDGVIRQISVVSVEAAQQAVGAQFGFPSGERVLPRDDPGDARYVPLAGRGRGGPVPLRKQRRLAGTLRDGTRPDRGGQRMTLRGSQEIDTPHPDNTRAIVGATGIPVKQDLDGTQIQRLGVAGADADWGPDQIDITDSEAVLANPENVGGTAASSGVVRSLDGSTIRVVYAWTGDVSNSTTIQEAEDDPETVLETFSDDGDAEIVLRNVTTKSDNCKVFVEDTSAAGTANNIEFTLNFH
jgi:hypothetical protein